MKFVLTIKPASVSSRFRTLKFTVQKPEALSKMSFIVASVTLDRHMPSPWALYCTGPWGNALPLFLIVQNNLH